MATRNKHWLRSAYRGMVYDIRDSIDHLRCWDDVCMVAADVFCWCIVVCYLIVIFG